MGTAPQEDETLASSSVFNSVVESIAKSTGTEPSELTDDTQITELGVDSIMAIEIVSVAKAETGVDLPATFAFDYPTIGDLRRELGGSIEPQGVAGASAGSDASTEPSTPGSPDSGRASTPDSVSSAESSMVHVDKDVGTLKDEVASKSQPVQSTVDVKDTSPQPNARITLLQGRPGPGKSPFYLMADGTGSIASYIHLPAFKSKMPVYGVDSPFLRCPGRLTKEVGMEGVAKHIVDALIKAQPQGSFNVGGYSAGCHVAYEVVRQLGAAGRKVDGLVIIDLRAPSGTDLSEAEIEQESQKGVEALGATVAMDELWSGTAARQQDHLRAYFVAMRTYNPPPMTAEERPGLTAVIWAKKGLVNRAQGDEKVMKLLSVGGFPTKPYPGFMEDAKLSPMACLVPNKTKKDLGANGWDKYAGDVLPLTVDADHLDLPMPSHVKLLHEQLEKAFAHFYP